MKHQDLTGEVIGCFFTAYNELGFGLPERVYSTALETLFRDLGINANSRKKLGLLLFFGPSPEIERVSL
jgi:hypothetical protein